VNDAVPVQVPEHLAQLQAQRYSAGHRQLRLTELVPQRFGLWEIGDQKRAALVHTEGQDRETALVPETAQGPCLAFEPGQLATALDVAQVPELEPGRQPAFERLGAKGGAVRGRAKDLEQPPTSADHLMEEGVGARMHGRFYIG
jgi:hypothetical protein